VGVLTGAGVSTDSGIPDFRGPDGVWTRDPSAQRYVEYHRYLAEPALRRQSWQRRLHHPARVAAPNAAHLALAELWRAGLVEKLVTQNIDGLHQAAGMPDEAVLELHGSMGTSMCVACGDRLPLAETLKRVADGEADPPCLRCGGVLKSGTIMFGEEIDDAVFGSAVRAAASCHLFLAIGTTLTVEPAASLCRVAVERGARLVIINRDPTPYDRLAVALLREPIGTAVPRLATRLISALDGESVTD
jgi:NAD-dependent deacetylase